MDFVRKSPAWVNGDAYQGPDVNRLEDGVVEGITKAEAAQASAAANADAITAANTVIAAKASSASPTFTGTVTVPALRVSGGSPGAGKVLTSDSSGNGTWQPAGGIGANYPQVVLVSTGTETRPTGSVSVLWIDMRGEGAARPDNMDVTNDLWFTPNGAVSGDTTAPSVPTGLSSSSITAAGFSVSWSASTDNVAVTGYQVRLGTDAPISVSGTSYSFSGLTASTAYSVTVRARDAAGNWSAYSSALSVTTSSSGDTTAPSVPTGLASSSITSSGFTVSWTASTDNVAVTGYEVFIDGVSYATPSGTSQAVTGRSASTAYSVTVRARDAAGNWSAQSSALSVTTSSGADTTAPSVPTGLTSSAITTSGFTVSWTASTDNVAVTGYEVFIDGTSYGTTSSTSLAVTGRSANTAYSVTVRARDAVPNWSAQSSALSVTTLDPLAPISRFNFNEGSGTTATSTNTLYTLTDQTGGSPVWGSGTIKSKVRGYPIGTTGSALAQWSVAIDFTLNALPGSEASFYVKEEAANTFFNLTASGQVKVYGVATTTSTATVSTGSPHRLVITQNATTLKVYLDGTEIISATEQRDFQRIVNTLVYTSGLNIDIDTFRVWDLALSAGQVSALGA